MTSFVVADICRAVVERRLSATVAIAILVHRYGHSFMKAQSWVTAAGQQVRDGYGERSSDINWGRQK